MKAAVLGLGEAGRIYAGELVGLGFEVRGFDIRRVADPPAGVVLADSACAAVADAELVLSLTTAAGSLDAATAARPGLTATTVYADLNAASPQRKAEVAAALPGTQFADVAVLAPAARKGIRTPVLAAGSGANAFAELLRPFHTDIEVLPGPPGTAAGRKLLRSIFMKGLAATVLEALTAGRAADCECWVRRQIVAELGATGENLVERLVTGTYQHARRRLHEMQDSQDYVQTLGTPSDMTAATITWLGAVESGSR